MQRGKGRGCTRERLGKGGLRVSQACARSAQGTLHAALHVPLEPSGLSRPPGQPRQSRALPHVLRQGPPSHRQAVKKRDSAMSMQRM